MPRSSSRTRRSASKRGPRLPTVSAARSSGSICLTMRRTTTTRTAASTRAPATSSRSSTVTASRSRTGSPRSTAPIARGASVVAGSTSYAGALAPLANELDFPYFDWDDKRRRFAATSARTTSPVRNFFANNVAFARPAFASRRYPTIAPMFHGQCQVLALRFVEAGIPIVYAREARVTHAWPGSLAEWLEVRLLRGADTTQLLPHVLAHVRAARASRDRKLGPLPALAILGLRAVTGAWSALRRGPALRGLALVAGVTAVDAIGAAAAPAVYRCLGIA